MSKIIRVAAVLGCAALALAFVIAQARAQTFVDVPCKPLAEIDQREAFKALTPAQWNFARALFVAAPNTPMALPPGDGAVLRREPGGGGMLLFVDGDEACAPLGLPPDVIELFDEIAKGVVTHPPGRM
jgi:hypothetical protein